MKWFKIILRLIIGAFFLLSAYGKVEAMEAFEIYIFRSSFLSFDGASVVARLIVAAELIAAVGFITKWGYKAIWKLTMIFILILTAFLAWQAMAGDEANCFCLGELMEMSPTESLLKNVGLIMALLFVRREEDVLTFKFKRGVTSVVFTTALVIPFIMSPPDIFVKGRFKPAEHNQEVLDLAIEDGSIPADFVSGRTLVSFYSTGCKYCKMAATRLSVIIDKNQIDKGSVHQVFWGEETDPTEFYEKTHSMRFEYVGMPTKQYLDITKGRMPLILLIDDGEVVDEMTYRTIDAGKIIQFLKGN